MLAEGASHLSPGSFWGDDPPDPPMWGLRPHASLRGGVSVESADHVVPGSFWGDGTTDLGTRTDSPIYGLLGGVTAIANTDQNGSALRSDGTLYAWGANDRGQLGAGFAGHATGPQGQGYYAPLPLAVNAHIKAVTPGMALTESGVVITWGTNESLQLGNGSTDVNAIAASPVTVLTDVTAISEYRNGLGGVTRYALKTDGTVWSWATAPAAPWATTPTAGPAQLRSRSTVCPAAPASACGCALPGQRLALGRTGFGGAAHPGGAATARRTDHLRAAGQRR